MARDVSTAAGLRKRGYGPDRDLSQIAASMMQTIAATVVRLAPSRKA